MLYLGFGPTLKSIRIHYIAIPGLRPDTGAYPDSLNHHTWDPARHRSVTGFSILLYLGFGPTPESIRILVPERGAPEEGPTRVAAMTWRSVVEISNNMQYSNKKNSLKRSIKLALSLNRILRQKIKHAEKTTNKSERSQGVLYSRWQWAPGSKSSCI